MYCTTHNSFLVLNFYIFYVFLLFVSVYLLMLVFEYGFKTFFCLSFSMLLSNTSGPLVTSQKAVFGTQFLNGGAPR